MTSFFDFLFNFILRNQHVLKPLGNRALDLGVQLVLQDRSGRSNISDMARDFAKHRSVLEKLVEKATADSQGGLLVVFADQDIFRLEFDGQGNHDIILVGMKGKARDFFTQLGKEMTEFREAFIRNFSEEDLHDLIDLSADFLDEAAGETFSYTLVADGIAFVKGALNDRDLNLQLLDVLVYIKTGLFLLEGSNFLNVKLTSPLDLMKLFEGAQGALRHLATTYQIADLRIQAGVAGQTVFMAGRDVKPNFTSAFGPVNLQLDSVFKIISATLSKV